MASQIVESGALANPPTEEADAQRDSPAGAFKAAVFALVRLKAYGPLAAAVLDGAQPRVRWWPVAYALQRLEDPRAVSALLTLAQDPHPYTRAFAAKGLGPLKDRAAVPVLISLATSAGSSCGHRGRPIARPPRRSCGRSGVDEDHSGAEARSAAAPRSRVGDWRHRRRGDVRSPAGYPGRSQPADSRGHASSAGAARSRGVRDGAVRAGSRSSLDRAGRARDGSRDAAAGDRPAAPPRDARRRRRARHSFGARVAREAAPGRCGQRDDGPAEGQRSGGARRRGKGPCRIEAAGCGGFPRGGVPVRSA